MLVDRRYIYALIAAGLAEIVLALMIVLLMPGGNSWPVYLAVLLSGFAGALICLGWTNWRRISQNEREQEHRAHPGLPWQLNKLFLFNTLHNIAALTVVNTERARDVIEKLAAYIRTVIEIHHRPMTLLTLELRCAELLLSLEQARLGQRLLVRKDIAANCLEIPVPGLILQPVVEHAVLNGVEMSTDPVEVVLSARRDKSMLYLEVIDDALVSSQYQQEDKTLLDLGFPNLSQMLFELYGKRARIEIITQQPRGTCVRISLPASAVTIGHN